MEEYSKTKFMPRLEQRFKCVCVLFLWRSRVYAFSTRLLFSFQNKKQPKTVNAAIDIYMVHIYMYYIGVLYAAAFVTQLLYIYFNFVFKSNKH